MNHRLLREGNINLHLCEHSNTTETQADTFKFHRVRIEAKEYRNFKKTINVFYTLLTVVVCIRHLVPAKWPLP